MSQVIETTPVSTVDHIPVTAGREGSPSWPF